MYPVYMNIITIIWACSLLFTGISLIVKLLTVKFARLTTISLTISFFVFCLSYAIIYSYDMLYMNEMFL